MRTAESSASSSSFAALTTTCSPSSSPSVTSRQVGGHLSQLDLAPLESVFMNDETKVVAVLDPDRLRRHRQHVVEPRQGDLDLGAHPRPEPARDVFQLDDPLEIMNVRCASSRWPSARPW